VTKSLPVAADLYGDLLDYEAPPPSGMRAQVPGLMVAGIAALAAAYLSEHYGGPLMLTGLLLGLSLNFVNVVPQLHAGLDFASKTLLRWGIVLLGTQITLAQIAGLGIAGLAAVAAMIALVTLTGLLAARALRLSPWLGLLAGGAVAICGASAALALSALLGERRIGQAQLTLVLVCVAGASAFAMSVYPLLAHALGLDDRQAGFLIGASVHDVAQALGAGYSISPGAGEMAAIVKLTRVALLAPTLAVISLFLARDPDRNEGRIAIPWFVAGFFALAALCSYWPQPAIVTATASRLASALLLLAVVATGIGSPMQLLLRQGWRTSMPVLAATTVSLALALAGAIVLF
jgi:uncharacterized integral membrane protein (TIGR00698 family)